MPAFQLVRLSMPLRAVPAGRAPMPLPPAMPYSPAYGHGQPYPHASPIAVALAPNGPQQPPEPVATGASPPYRRPPAEVVPNAAAGAWSLAGALARLLGDAAWWLDRATYGKRLFWLLVAGAIVLATKSLAVDAYVPALLFYSTFLYLLLLARLWWVRDDAGNWTWSHFIERSLGVMKDAFAGLFQGEEFSLQNLLEQLQLVLLSTGLSLAVLAPPLGALARFLLADGTVAGLLATVELGGQVLVGLGIVPWLLKRLRGKSAAAKHFKQAAAALGRTASYKTVPLIIDVRQPSNLSGQVPVEFEPLLSILAQWRPRASEREAGYERSLVRFLERNMPGIDAQTQLPFQAEDGTRGRIDIVLDEVVAIELKRDLRASADADRAVGQVLKYAASWRRGPVLLLLCEASAEVADLPVLKRIAELREGGRSLFVVAAGRWGT
jgi:hypothetical protein